MKILNFIPLLIWMLGFIPMVQICQKMDGGTMSKEGAESVGAFYLFGCAIWVMIGIGITCLSP